MMHRICVSPTIKVTISGGAPHLRIEKYTHGNAAKYVSQMIQKSNNRRITTEPRVQNEVCNILFLEKNY